jgi:hypothetical protein
MTQAVHKKTIETITGYLPAPKPFHERYPPETQLEQVRANAMSHFGVENHVDRDTHEFFLEFEGRRIQDYSQTLAGLLGEEEHETAHFELVEQVTAGGC